MIYSWHVERRSVGAGRPDYFVRRTGRRPWLEVMPDGVPDFEGADAWFAVEKLPGKPLRFLRQIERPTGL
jgi:hypothetical protein